MLLAKESGREGREKRKRKKKKDAASSPALASVESTKEKRASIKCLLDVSKRVKELGNTRYNDEKEFVLYESMHDAIVAGVFDWLSFSLAQRFLLFSYETFSFTLAHLFFSLLLLLFLCTCLVGSLERFFAVQVTWRAQ